MPESHSNTRSPELDFVIAKHESPKVRLPKRLPSRAPNEKEFIQLERVESMDEDEQEDEAGTWDRHFVKSVSLKALKQDLKRRQQQNAASVPTTPAAGESRKR
jgi:hypothetical protein